MKRLAVLCDFHGNSYALEAVVAEARKLGCDEYLCCGDYVGYYYEPDKVIDLVRTLASKAILGNHDWNFLRLLDGAWQITDGYKKEYGSSLEMARDNMKPGNIKWLRSLPPTLEILIENEWILLCHGSPWDINEYLYPDMSYEQLDELYALSYDLVIVGHSHYQYVKKREEQFILSPGSVGQARDGGGATWAMVTIESNNIDIELMKTTYDTKELIVQAKLIDPRANYLYEALSASKAEKVKLREVCNEDCKLLWEWACDPIVRAASFGSDAISWDRHVIWFQQKIVAPDCVIYIVIDERGNPIGQVRFEIDSKGSAEIDISIDAKERKKGYGAYALKIACQQAFKAYNIETVLAYVKEDNKASIRVFVMAGFIDKGLRDFKGHKAIEMIWERKF